MVRTLSAAAFAAVALVPSGVVVDAAAHMPLSPPPTYYQVVVSAYPQTSTVGQTITFSIPQGTCADEFDIFTYDNGNQITAYWRQDSPNSGPYYFRTNSLGIGEHVISIDAIIGTAQYIHCVGQVNVSVKPKPLPPPPPKPKPPPSPVASPSPSPTPEESPSPQPSPSPATAARTAPASPARRLTANFMPIDIAAVGVVGLIALAIVSLWLRASRLSST